MEKPTWEWTYREDMSIPTLTLENLFLTIMIDTRERQDMMMVDMLNMLIQTKLPPDKNREKFIVKIIGLFVDILVEDSQHIYGAYVVWGMWCIPRNDKRVIWGCDEGNIWLIRKWTIVLFWFEEDFEEIGFEFNQYALCMANRIIDDKQHTI